VEQLEKHYLFCDECFDEIGATGLLMDGLQAAPLTSSRVGEVAILRFPQPSQLLAVSPELQAILDTIRYRNESRVLIDLSMVSRIDSTGLGVLMSCHCHALRNSGALKLLNPTAPVRAVLQVTRIDSVLEGLRRRECCDLQFQLSWERKPAPKLLNALTRRDGVRHSARFKPEVRAIAALKIPVFAPRQLITRACRIVS
jgi:anti-sigma B factor antagonist